jgi:hypothetical protein
LGNLIHAGFGCNPFERVQPRAVADKWRSTSFQNHPGYGAHYFWIGGDAPFWWVGGKQVGLEQHSIPWPYEAGDSTKQIYGLSH